MKTCRSGRHTYDGAKYRQCPECRRESVSKVRATNPEKAREAARKWYAANPEKARRATRKWQAANPEKARDIARKWHEANPEKAREKNRKWYAENPEKAREKNRKWREANPEKAREAARKGRIVNSEKVRVRNSRRRAHKRLATIESFTYVQIQVHMMRWGGSCAYCDRGNWEHDDHVVPLARGGSHSLDNLVPACATCNLRKGTKQWTPRKPLMTSYVKS